MLLTPQLEGHNCALDTPSWQFEGVGRTLQAWLDTQKNGNITGKTGIIWSWAGQRWQDGYFYSEEGEGGHSHTGLAVYIYPDLKSGLKGEFRKGLLVRGQGV